MAIKGQEEMNLSNLRVSVGKEGVRNKAVGGRDPATINEQGSEDPNKEGKDRRPWLPRWFGGAHGFNRWQRWLAKALRYVSSLLEFSSLSYLFFS